MKAIGHLGGLRRAPADRVRIRPVAIAADDHNPRMRGEPGRHGIRRAHREDIHHAASLQIHENGAEMLLALLPGPVIDTHDAERLIDVGWRGPAFDEAHDGVGTHRHAQPVQQALAGAPAERMPDQMHDDSQTLRMRASGPTTPGKRSAKTTVSHSGFRHRHRLTRTRSVTAWPCAAKSFIVRQYRLCRAVDGRPRPGHGPDECPSASTTRPSSLVTMASNVNGVPLGRTPRHVGKRFIAPASALHGPAPEKRQTRIQGSPTLVVSIFQHNQSMHWHRE